MGDWRIGPGGSQPVRSTTLEALSHAAAAGKGSGVLFERGARKLGYHPFPSPMAILSQPRPGRSACVNCGFCLGFGCEVGAKSSSLASVIRWQKAPGDARFARTVTSTRLTPTRMGARREQSTLMRTAIHVQKAKAVILCANGAETPRLLLLSANNHFPNGLGEFQRACGKYLMPNSAPSVGSF